MKFTTEFSGNRDKYFQIFQWILDLDSHTNSSNFPVTCFLVFPFLQTKHGSVLVMSATTATAIGLSLGVLDFVASMSYIWGAVMEMLVSKITFVNFQAAVALTLNYLCNFTSHYGLFLIRQCRCTLLIRQYFLSINIISH